MSAGGEEVRRGPDADAWKAAVVAALNSFGRWKAAEMEARAVMLVAEAFVPLRRRLRSGRPWWRGGVRRLRAPTAGALIARAKMSATAASMLHV
jgi:hypothetical protein